MRIRERLLGRVKGGTRSLRSALTVSLLLLGALVLPSRPLAAAPTTLVNVGMQPSWDCSDPAISGDGRYVAFSTSAGNIVPLDENHARDVFVYDRQTGHTERVS
ncbi:MAG: hypothetical protein GTN78_14300, partial [Gemmatimonadales bacterium]|nr:hypothetical protein [Gemmatimonadales bacterium]